MRILIASQTYYPGTNGQAVFTIRLAEGLAQAGHTVLVLTPFIGDGAPSGPLNGVQVQAAPAWSLTWLHPALVWTVQPGPAVAAALDTFQPEIVHIQDHYALCAEVVRAARARRLPLLGTNHFLPENLLPNFWPNLTRRPWVKAPAERVLWAHMLSVFNQLDAATSPSETAARILRAQAIQVPVQAISCGVDLSRFRRQSAAASAEVRARYGLPADRPLLLYVGRHDREKRLDLLLQALAQLPAGAAHLALVGRGGALADLQALAQHLQISGQVTFLGYLPAETLPVMLTAADIFLMPSPEELQSIATLEALATGRPIIAANARALPELVEHGVNGYCFRPGDAADLARRIQTLLADPGQRRAMGAASLARARTHDITVTVQHYAGVYGRLSGARLRRPAGARPAEAPRNPQSKPERLPPH